MEQFDIAIGIFIFKRGEKAGLIIDQISKIRPLKLYLIGDGPRNDMERAEVERCRQEVEKHITWDCTVIKNYADSNRGVYENIAGGAKWILERESSAIFLEDDNFPALSFFPFCREMLERYKDDSRILWVCGTNYLKEYEPEDGSDYVFTQLMLPCGWASWSHKFAKFYDGRLSLYDDCYVKERIKKNYRNKALLWQNIQSWEIENRRIKKGLKPMSWDFQMAFTIRAHNLLGIAPKFNQIMNIGADIYSTHGGVSMDLEMTSRFCEIPTKELSFPLIHPKVCLVDLRFERLTEKIIVEPWLFRVKSRIAKMIKCIFKIDADKSITVVVKQLFR